MANFNIQYGYGIDIQISYLFVFTLTIHIIADTFSSKLAVLDYLLGGFGSAKRRPARAINLEDISVGKVSEGFSKIF